MLPARMYTHTMSRIRVEPAVIAALSVWEAVALLTRRIPTITAVSKRLPASLRRGLACSGAVWLIRHLW